MFNGIGTDIVEILRIKKAVESEHFMHRVFTKNEIDYAMSKGNPEQSFAGIFCAKESIVKAMGTGFSGVKFHDIEILHDELGKPYCTNENILISISHCKEYATAMAFIKE
ncbi:MAG: holo-ACP synthase [Clostridia bacterium]